MKDPEDLDAPVEKRSCEGTKPLPVLKVDLDPLPILSEYSSISLMLPPPLLLLLMMRSKCEGRRCCCCKRVRRRCRFRYQYAAPLSRANAINPTTPPMIRTPRRADQSRGERKGKGRKKGKGKKEREGLAERATKGRKKWRAERRETREWSSRQRSRIEERSKKEEGGMSEGRSSRTRRRRETYWNQCPWPEAFQAVALD